jgi:HlyD family secretion protein
LHNVCCSSNAPKPVINKTPGKLIKLFAKEGDKVKENAALGYMESIASPEQVLKLSSAIDSINEIVNKHLELLPAYIKNFNFENLGELQQPYQTFIQAFIVYKDYIGNVFYARKKQCLKLT